MEFIETGISGLYLLSPRIFRDNRGYFFENYRQSDFEEQGLRYKWVQENRSYSSKGVLRGMGFQRQYSQAKLVSVLRGEIFDVVVDLRKNSDTFLQWKGFLLSGENRMQLLIPRGFAHGFLVLSDGAEISFKCDNYYHPEDECGFIWNDKTVGIAWPDVDNLTISVKDAALPMIDQLDI